MIVIWVVRQQRISNKHIHILNLITITVPIIFRVTKTWRKLLGNYFSAYVCNICGLHLYQLLLVLDYYVLEIVISDHQLCG